MIEVLTVLLLFGALLYRIGLSLTTIGIVSALTSAFFFIYFLSRKGFLAGIVIGGVVMLGAINAGVHIVNTGPDFFASRTITGPVQSVDRRLDKTIVVVRDDQYKKIVQATTHFLVQVVPGDIVQVTGTIDRPEDFMTTTGRLFPYQNYLLSKNIVATIPLAHIVVVASGRFSIIRLATVVRFRIADIFTNYIHFPTDGLVAGMLVGYQGGIPANIQDLFRTTGVLHVLVLSGENITLLVLFLGIVLRPLPFHIRLIIIGGTIVLVVLVSGAGVAAVRAGIMGIIALAASVVRRNYIPLRALTISVLFFFFYSPETIFIDPGFHLSVLATIFMVVVVPKIEPLFYWLPENYHLRELGMLALCVPLFMLPYTMYFSGLVPLASPFANILMAIITPVLMLGGALLLSMYWLAPLAQVVGLLISYIGSVTITLLNTLNHLPQINTPPLAWWGVILCYGIFFGIVFRFEFKQFWYGLKSAVLLQTNSSEPRNQ